MNDSRRPFGATEPEPIDDNEDRMGSMETLDFDEEEPGRIGDLIPETSCNMKFRISVCVRQA